MFIILWQQNLAIFVTYRDAAYSFYEYIARVPIQMIHLLLLSQRWHTKLNNFHDGWNPVCNKELSMFPTKPSMFAPFPQSSYTQFFLGKSYISAEHRCCLVKTLTLENAFTLTSIMSTKTVCRKCRRTHTQDQEVQAPQLCFLRYMYLFGYMSVLARTKCSQEPVEAQNCTTYSMRYTYNQKQL